LNDPIALWLLLGLGFAVGVPTCIISLFWRQYKLRRQIIELSQIHNEQNDALHREMLELKRQLAAVSHPIPEVRRETQPAPARPRPVEKPPAAIAVEKPVTVERPITPSIPAVPAAVASTASGNEQQPTQPSPPEPPRFCSWCGTVHAGGPTNCPPKFVTQAARVETPATTVVKPPVEKEAFARESKAATIEHLAPSTPASAPPHVSPTKPIEPLPQKPVQVPLSARATSPSPVASLRTPPRINTEKRIKSVFALEETLGRNWLNKLGITLLVLGIASFGIYELGQLGPLGKVAVSYAVASALLIGGIFLEKRENYRVLGHTLIGGGWSLFFFTTYALHHVDGMRVMSSDTADLIFMLIVASAMVVHTLRYRSQLVTGLAFLLGYSTVALSHDNVYGLSAGVVLTIGLVCIVLKMGWFELEVFGIISSYLNHLYWLYRLLGAGGAQGHAFPEYHASAALLLFYWITFRISYVARKIRSSSDEHMSTTAALLNTLLLLGTMKFQSVHPELAFTALLIIGAVEFIFGQLPVIKRRREAFIVLTVLGAALMIAAVPFRYSGNNVAILWVVAAEAFLIAGVMVGEVVFRRLGLFAGLLVAAHLAAIDFRHLIDVRRTSENLVLSAGIMFALCAVVFYVNALFVGQRWQVVKSWPDGPLISIHSYVGAFAATCAAWALCSGDQTALAFAGVMLLLASIAQGEKLSGFKLSHLQAQYGVIAGLAVYRILLFNLHADIPQYTHVRARLVTLPILAAMFYVTAKLSALRDDDRQQTFRGLFALVGTALMFAVIYYEVPEFWQCLATIVFAVLLLEIGQRFRYYALAWHAHILSAIAVIGAFSSPDGPQWHSIPLRAIAALPVVGCVYWIAKRIGVSRPEHNEVARAIYSWTGTGVMAWVLYAAMPEPWIAVAWIAFAVVIAVVLRRIDYEHLAWQANALAAAAVVRAFTFNCTLDHGLWHGVSLRLLTVVIVAAGLYFLSRNAVARDSDAERAITYLHTFAATGLLALLAWYEAPSAWLAAIWALFAIVLAVVDRQFEADDLRWQAHALALLAIVRSVAVNLNTVDTWSGVSVRLLSLAIVTVVFYAMSQILRMPDEWRAREFHHAYSWIASALVALLMWYELQPVTVAVGWAVFGLVLFEYGLVRNVRQFRFQSYVALIAAFGRIFFANLTAGVAGEFWGPRTYTVLPIALILFFVYSQLQEDDKKLTDDSRLRLDVLVAYLGTGTIVALLYFQFANDWLATAWATLVFILFAISIWLRHEIFVYQALLLTVGTCTRGVMHNLFGASYFTGGNWTGRYLVLGSAIAILFACLPFAFQLRDRERATAVAGNWRMAIVRRPEQFMFFAPVLLLTLMLTVKMRAGMVTVSWGLEGLLIALVAFAINERSFRLTGLSLLLLCFAKVLALDVWGLQPRDRYITFIVVGAALLLVSFLYSKYRDAIRQFL
jgi:hypothetical protein